MSHGCRMDPIDLHLSQVDNIQHELHTSKKEQSS